MIDEKELIEYGTSKIQSNAKHMELMSTKQDEAYYEGAIDALYEMLDQFTDYGRNDD